MLPRLKVALKAKDAATVHIKGVPNKEAGETVFMEQFLLVYTENTSV